MIAQQARNLALLHFGSMADRGGDPLINHLQRVVDRLADQDDETQAIGWLHDIIEDTKVTVRDLTAFPEVVVQSVCLLTHNKKKESYDDYIERICRSGDRRAVFVKLADQADNLDPHRWLTLDRHVQNALRKKYAGVQDRLLKAAIGLIP